MQKIGGKSLLLPCCTPNFIFHARMSQQSCITTGNTNQFQYKSPEVGASSLFFISPIKLIQRDFISLATIFIRNSRNFEFAIKTVRYFTATSAEDIGTIPPTSPDSTSSKSPAPVVPPLLHKGNSNHCLPIVNNPLSNFHT